MELGIGGLGHGTVIGAGASATVYRATQVELDRDVAVKVLNATDNGFVRRFKQEARTLGKLSLHGGIVTVYDSGVNGSGQPYLILELCEDSLLDQLKQSGPFDPGEACQILAKVTEAVGSAHADGVVHRDIKPANLLRTSDGDVLVTDFGIATTIAAGETAEPRAGAGGFTAGYVAPEVIEGEPVGAPADVYGIGASLFHLVVGQAPFVGSDEDGPNLLVVVQRIANDPIGKLRPAGIPDAVWTIIEAAMAKDPSARPTVTELGRMLEAAADGLAGDDPPVTTPHPQSNIVPPQLPSKPDVVQGETPASSETIEVSNEPASRSPVLYAMAAGLVGCVVIVGLLLSIFGGDSSSNRVAAGEGDRGVGSPFVSELGEEESLSRRGLGSQQSGTFDPAGPPEIRSNLDSAAARVTVPDLNGQTQASAEAILATSGLRVNVVYQETSSVAVGRVISHDPAEGEIVFEDTLVTLFVSRETKVPPAPVPAVAGLSAADATAVLKAEKLTVANTLSIYHDTIPAGVVVGTDPSENKLVNANSAVTLFVSFGRPVIPEMSGFTAEQAVATLEELTLVAEVINGPGVKPLGTVEKTTPGHGVAVNTNTTIQVLIVDRVIPPDCTMDMATLIHHLKPAAEALVVAAGCEVGPELPPEFHQHVAAGNVIRGERFGPAVKLVISKGPVPVPVCDPAELANVVTGITGMTRTAAVAAITQIDCTVGPDLPAEPNATVVAGLVLRGEVLGTTVRLVLAEAASATCTVPPLAGLSVADATLAVRTAGCTGEIDAGGAAPADVVTGSDPDTGVTISAADPIVLTTAPVQVTVPLVVGIPVADATAALDAMRLIVAVVDVPLPAGDPRIGFVTAQQPAVGQVPVGSTITIEVGVEEPLEPATIGSTVPDPSPVALP